MTENLAEDLDELARELDREHVFHSWSAQSQLSSLVVASGRGCRVWDHAGTRVPRLLEPARERQHRPPASGRRAGDPRAGRAAHDHRAVDREPRPRRGREAHHRPRAVGLPQGVLHQRRRRRERERDPDGAPAHRARQDPLDATARTTATPAPRSCRPATGAASPTSSRAATCTSSGPTSTAPSSGRRRPRRSRERALHHLRRVIEAEGPVVDRGGPARDRSRARPASCCRRPATSPGVRELCDRHGILLILDEVMCGLRPQRSLVRVRRLRRATRPHHLREGRELGLRAGGRRDHLRPDRGHVRRPGVPGRTHLLGASARDGLDRRDARRDGVARASSRTPRAIGETEIGPALAELAERHDVIGEVRGEGVFWAVELVADPETREPLPAAAMGRIKSALVARGLLPFVAGQPHPRGAAVRRHGRGCRRGDADLR